MLNFRKIYEYLWTSFRVSRDTALVAKLIQEGEGYGILVKHTWYYGLFTLFRYLVPIIILAGVNTYFIYERFQGGFFAYLFDTILIGLTLYLALLSIRYLRIFKGNYSKGTRIRNFKSILKELEDGDKSFTSFFNQLQTVFFLSICAVTFDILYIAYSFIFSPETISSTGLHFVVLEIICLIVQIFLNRHFNNNVINLEMDYMIATRDHIYFVDQKAMYTDARSIERDKIKTIRSSYPNFIASFFGYGNLDIMLEGGDILTGGVVQMETVQLPEETVTNLYELFTGKWRLVDKITNSFLRAVIEVERIMPDDLQFNEKISSYLLANETKIQNQYINSSDPGFRSDIYQLYQEYIINKTSKTEA